MTSAFRTRFTRMKPIYDDIGTHYAATRCTDPDIAARIFAELDGATRIVNIGAGTGSYEPPDVSLVAVEPSSRMIAQRPAGSHPVEQASAEALPFADNSFSHALTVLSMHHWSDRPQAFREINRVATDRFVALTWDPDAEPFWLTRDYFPEILETDCGIFPRLDALSDHFDGVEVQPVPIPAACVDGFLAAFWKRPAAYLSAEVRQSISSFATLGDITPGLDRLRRDLDSGRWAERNRDILALDALDVGYRLVTARLRAP